ncbi:MULTISPECIES: HRDC domain-containing protein [unclassified Actinomyces]|uniref:HRDC domain-containing protein n=1 Tax=unclassified Actinomyces TaxID=2609248 RepID=UPI0020175FE6|nr:MULTISPECIES: HRDC domain-containing protein [unclassified Actinomyces]MCL3778363.1 HRDC domain-containing protein [Actinomyces sp. AC-20-1]MCL3789951.1 HRDC domain-containing protein [Actinomyces sp. 187325]MCL3792170.1 HRDC domain-containing protein [Actinomyces sp. 186855]MCL3794335.1 HRDC domain-containing protein [Actinomyces sp. 217892]
MTPAPRPAPVLGTTAHPVREEEVVAYTRPRDGLPEVTDTPAALAAATAALAAGTGPVAVDAERASGFRYGQDAYLVQLRREGAGTVLVDPVSCGPTDGLGAVLAGPEWILHAADQDLPCLAELGLRPARLFDTELAARLLGREHVGLGAVVEETLGLRLAKDHAAADWSTRPLPRTWLVYAALDVELLIDLRDALAAELEAVGKAEWAAQEFEHERTRPPRPAKVDPWRKTPRAGRAVRSPRSLAVLRELWTAREDKARELDRTPSKVLSHQALVAAAVARPTSRRKMQALREFSSRQARQHQELWWQAIDRALRLDESELPPAHAPLGEGELPQPRSWARRHAEAATALEEVRAAVRERADLLRLPQELLLSPEVQRRLAWRIGEQEAAGEVPDVSVRALSEVLAQLGARPWQVEQSARALSDALA